MSELEASAENAPIWGPAPFPGLQPGLGKRPGLRPCGSGLMLRFPEGAKALCIRVDAPFPNRGEAPDICLAQPNGLGSRDVVQCRAEGPAVCYKPRQTVRPSAL
jgi:hypothetical protein